MLYMVMVNGWATYYTKHFGVAIAFAKQLNGTVHQLNEDDTTEIVWQG